MAGQILHVSLSMRHWKASRSQEQTAARWLPGLGWGAGKWASCCSVGAECQAGEMRSSQRSAAQRCAENEQDRAVHLKTYQESTFHAMCFYHDFLKSLYLGHCYSFFKKDFIYSQRKGKGGRKRGRETPV